MTDSSMRVTYRVVSRSAKSPSERAEGDSSVAILSLSNSVRKIPYEHPSRLKVMQCVLGERGFSRTSVKEITRAVRRSSSDIYQGKWSIICSRCHQRTPSPLRATQIADFLVHLHWDKGLSISAVRVTVLLWTKFFPLREWTSPPHRSPFIKSFLKSCPP